MVSVNTSAVLDSYLREGGLPLFGHSLNVWQELAPTLVSENIILTENGCTQILFDAHSGKGSVSHSFSKEDDAPWGSDSPVFFKPQTDLIYDSVIEFQSCPHVGTMNFSSELFAFARFLAITLDEGGIFEAGLSCDYLCAGQDLEISKQFNIFVEDMFNPLMTIDCTCGQIAQKALGDRGETFQG